MQEILVEKLAYINIDVYNIDSSEKAPKNIIIIAIICKENSYLSIKV
jgi:hypothetical protein